MSERVTIKVAATLTVDPAAYYSTYGVQVPQLPSDVESYLVDLLTYCAAGAEGCWDVAAVKAWKGRSDTRSKLGAGHVLAPGHDAATCEVCK